MLLRIVLIVMIHLELKETAEELKMTAEKIKLKEKNTTDMGCGLEERCSGQMTAEELKENNTILLMTLLVTTESKTSNKTLFDQENNVDACLYVTFIKSIPLPYSDYLIFHLQSFYGNRLKYNVFSYGSWFF